MTRDVFGNRLPPLTCPDCPGCGHPPRLVLSAVQAFCHTEACPVVCWNPSKTQAVNMAGVGYVDLSALEPKEHP